MGVIIANELEVIQGCIANDRRCQESLYRHYFPVMMRMVQRYTQDEDEVISILNNGFMRVYKKIHTFESKGSLEGWVRRLVFHAVSDYFKSKEKSLRFLEIEEQQMPTTSTATEKLYYEDLLQLTDQLPNMTKQVFLLFAVEGCSHKDIAEQLQMSEGTSKWHLHEARKKLGKLLQQMNIQYHA